MNDIPNKFYFVKVNTNRKLETKTKGIVDKSSDLVRNPGTISVLVLLLMPRKRKSKSFNEGILEQATQINGYV